MTASYDHIKSQYKARLYLHDPADATVATKIAWVEMGKNFLAELLLVSGTGVLTFKIFAATDSSGTGATVVKAHSDPTVADAAGDMVHLEVSAEEVRAALAAATHVSVEVDMDANTDIAAVAYFMEGAGNGGRFAYDGITADVIA